jgi:uncharacterized membrane protein
MKYFFHDTAGFLHLLASLLALVFGTMVVVMPKGTKKHIRIGYLYFTSMVLLISTSFLIFRLFGRMGIFHYAAMASALILALGMFPIWLKRPRNHWRVMHYNFMYWSVVALYEAFASELLTRIPKSPFMGTVGIASGIMLLIGFIIFFKHKKKWEEEIGILRE